MAAMGAQSTLVRLLLRGGVSTNVMTTNTTLLAISVAEMLLGCIERMVLAQGLGDADRQAPWNEPNENSLGWVEVPCASEERRSQSRASIFGKYEEL